LKEKYKKMKKIKKPWGYEEHVETNEKYAVKRLFMKKGHQCSLQYHKIKKETIMILKGKLKIINNDQVYRMGPFDVITIEPGHIHRMIAETENCLYLEWSTPELEDVVRVEDRYGRK